MRMAMVIVALVVAPLAAAEIVEGTVRFEAGPLPGCTITLVSPLDTYTAITDERGTFRFSDVKAGHYEIRYELAGLVSVKQEIDVWRTITLPAQELEPGRMLCGGATCSEEPPATIFDTPLCRDVDFNTQLIESVRAGDRSVLPLLRQRYETADSFSEQHRLGSVLLEYLPDSTGAIWNELVKQASAAVRSPDVENKVHAMSVSALYAIGESPRARPLLHEALQSTDAEIVAAAVFGFAWQRDTSALPAIAAALERAGESAAEVAVNLALFRTEDADALALKYLAEDNRWTYFELRKPR
jgi:hypothetical protein